MRYYYCVTFHHGRLFSSGFICSALILFPRKQTRCIDPRNDKIVFFVFFFFRRYVRSPIHAFFHGIPTRNVRDISCIERGFFCNRIFFFPFYIFGFSSAIFTNHYSSITFFCIQLHISLL